MINGDEPGDGTIVAVDGEEVSVFAKGFNAPKGLVFVGQHLITADETTVWKVDAKGNATKLAEAKDFPAPIEFLNDVAPGKDGECVYVSEMSTPTPMFDPSGERKLFGLDSAEAKALPNKGCVYKITLEGKVSLAVPSGNPLIRFPNGVAVGGTKEQERLFVGDFFTGEIVRYNDGKYQTVANGPRGIDGLTVTKDHFFASSWIEGKVVKIDRKTKESKVLIDGLKSAADFFYDGKNQQLIVPDMLAGTLIFLPLE
jgi:sugar lactone lactonase YvrE